MNYKYLFLFLINIFYIDGFRCSEKLNCEYDTKEDFPKVFFLNIIKKMQESNIKNEEEWNKYEELLIKCLPELNLKDFINNLDSINNNDLINTIQIIKSHYINFLSFYNKKLFINSLKIIFFKYPIYKKDYLQKKKECILKFDCYERVIFNQLIKNDPDFSEKLLRQQLYPDAEENKIYKSFSSASDFFKEYGFPPENLNIFNEEFNKLSKSIYAQIELDKLDSYTSLLLHGKAGSGKTSSINTLIKNISEILYKKDKKLSIFYVESGVLDKYYGSEKRFLEQIFNEVLSCINCDENEIVILFIEEIDGFCPQRNINGGRKAFDNAHNDIANQTFKTLNTGYMQIQNALKNNKGKKMIFLSTSNYPGYKFLDPAFSRRFASEQIEYNYKISKIQLKEIVEEKIQNLKNKKYEFEEEFQEYQFYNRWWRGLRDPKLNGLSINNINDVFEQVAKNANTLDKNNKAINNKITMESFDQTIKKIKKMQAKQNKDNNENNQENLLLKQAFYNIIPHVFINLILPLFRSNKNNIQA